MQIKICGLTREAEAQYLNEAGADYAGFVFYEKSKRNVTQEQARAVMERLDKRIKRVAVTVSPDMELAAQIEKNGFDILQVHGTLSRKVLERTNLPVWYAFHIAREEDLIGQQLFLKELPKEQQGKIQGIVVDGAKSGSGIPFDWQLLKGLCEDPRFSDVFGGRKQILAGGIGSDNVQRAMALLSPDVIDVSSKVEGENGKNEQKVLEITRMVKNIREDIRHE